MIPSVLLIEDDDIVNYCNEFLLRDLGVTENISIAQNGQEALDFLAKCEAGEPGYVFPNLIFLDINMPMMNGFEFLDHFENVPYRQKVDALVVMLTTSLHTDDVERAKNYSSIIDYVYKPLLKEKVELILSKHFRDVLDS